MNTIASFFPAHLSQAQQRLHTSKIAYKHLLDKNEQADDVPDWMKVQVLQKAMEMEWNRYPSLSHADIENAIAQTLGISGEQVVLGSGSATFITTLLNYLGMQRRQIVITQPSYSLFDYHCKTYDIPYTPWMLNDDLEYDERLLPALQDGSALFIVSPNNPVGNTVSREMLVHILQSNPGTLVILDAVYAEFGGEYFHDLLQQFSNLIIMRSLSKEMPVAGLRLGYVCGHLSVINVIRKLLLPFTINPLSLAFARYLMFDVDFCKTADSARMHIICERERLHAQLIENIPLGIAYPYPSLGNFLLVRIPDDAKFAAVMQAFDAAGVKVLNTSSMPLLRNTFRVSIGSFEANDLVAECLMEVLSPVGIFA